MSLNRVIAAAVAALAIGIAASASNAGTPPDETHLTCTNPSSGATWPMSIDYARGTVDSHPARIGATEISWHDPTDGGNYTLDRKSGKLTGVFPSSMGGYFLHDLCRPDKPR